MKLFVLTTFNKVIAISESKKDMEAYIASKKYPSDTHYFVKIKKEKHIDDLMFQYEDLYLEHDDELDMVLTRVENQMIHSIIDEQRERIGTTIDDLQHYISNYKFSKKEKSVLLEAYKILESSKKKKKIRKVINLENFIGFVGKSKNIADVLRDRLHDTKEKIYLFINLKE